MIIMKNQLAPVRFAVIGSRRGRSFIQAAMQSKGAAELVAICDTNQENLDNWKKEYGDRIRLYSDYQQVLNDSQVDAVCIATPLTLHAQQSIAALKAGKHVLCEVIAAHTLEDCWELLETVRNSRYTYMMAENYCFMEPIMQVQRMVEEGVFGELVYASGSYLHDTRYLLHDKDGELTWRGELSKTYYGNTYPTHSLGPVAGWLGINRSDRLTKTSTWQSKSLANSHYFRSEFPQIREYQLPDYWKRPDTVSTTIHTENGVLIDLRVDWCSTRPHNGTRYELQGTKASFYWTDGLGPMIWIEGRSPIEEKYGRAGKWDSLWKYRDEFEHPWWAKMRADAETAGHGGGDHFVLGEFVSAINEGRNPVIDACDAVTWSSIFPLSMMSIDQNNAAIDIPDFRLARE